MSDQLADLLLNDSNVTSLLKVSRIEQQGFVNVDADNTPWIGIYRPGINNVGLRLGNIADWELEETILVVVQATSYKTGAECEQLLDNVVGAIITSINADKTILGTVENVEGIKISYEYNYEDRETLYFQSANIELKTSVAMRYD